MVIIAAGTIYETMPTVQLTSRMALQLLVSLQLRVIPVAWRWGNIILTSSLLRLAGRKFGLTVTISRFCLMV